MATKLEVVDVFTVNGRDDILVAVRALEGDFVGGGEVFRSLNTGKEWRVTGRAVGGPPDREVTVHAFEAIEGGECLSVGEILIANLRDVDGSRTVQQL